MASPLNFTMLPCRVLLVLSMCTSGLLLAESPGSLDSGPTGLTATECYRRDTLEVMPVRNAEDVDAFMDLAYEVSYNEVLPSVRTLSHVARIADSLEMYDARHFLLLELMVMKADNHPECANIDGDSLAIVISESLELADEDFTSDTYNVLGIYKSMKGNYVESIVNFQEVYQSALPDQIFERFHAIGNLAGAYNMIGDTVSSIRLLHESLRLALELPEDDDFSVEYSNTFDYGILSELYLGLNVLDSAAYYYRLSELNHYKMKGHPRFDETRRDVLIGRIKLSIALGDLDKAQLSIDTLYEIGSIGGVHGERLLYAAKGLYSNAIQAALVEAKEGYTDAHLILKDLVKYSLSAKQNENALAYSRQLNDSLENKLLETNLGLVRATEAQRASFYRQQEADRARHKQELAVLVERQRLWVSIGMLLLCIAGGIYGWRRYLRSSKRSKDLSLMVSERDRDLLEMNKQLAERMASMEQFNHLLSHDLREPIRSISGFTTLLKRRFADVPNASQDLNHLAQSVDQLKHLIAGIEELRKLEDIAKSDRFQTVEDLCKVVTSKVSRKYPETTINFKIDSAAKPMLVSKELTSIALSELLYNAALFTPVGIKSPEVYVTTIGSTCTFRILDFGIGIEDKYHTIIFESFKRLNQRELYPGSGIGLTIAKQAAEHAGGTLMLVHSTLGAGSVFELTIAASTANVSDGSVKKVSTRKEVA